MSKTNFPGLNILWITTKIGSVIVLTYAASIYLVRHSDILAARKDGSLASLLFGAASIALAAFAAIVAIVALAGWQSIKTTIQDTVKAEISQKISAMENEMKGRVFSGLGFMIGEMSIDPETLESRNRIRLLEAVSLCEEGYKFLQLVERPVKFLGLNNLVFYACILRDDFRKEFLLKQSKILEEAGHEHGATNLLLTASRVALQYGSAAERRAAHDLLASLQNKQDLSEREKKELEIYLKIPVDARKKRPQGQVGDA